MRRLLVLFSVIWLMAGCATVNQSSVFFKNDENSLKSFFVGTWSGEVQDNMWAQIKNRGVILNIWDVNGNSVIATVNGRSVEIATLYIYKSTVVLKMISLTGTLYILEPFGENHLVGSANFNRGIHAVNSVLTLKKLPKAG